MNRMPYKRNLVMAALVSGLVLTSACKSADKAEVSTQAEETAPTQDTPPTAAPAQMPAANSPAARPTWLTRGGSLNRASSMEEWSAADEEERLASAADLVSMSMRKAGKPMPSIGDFEKLAREFEKELSAKDSDGSRNKDTVGAIVDEVLAETAP